jgi:methylisocitrate lyase
MFNAAGALRKILNSPGYLVRPSICDPFMARMAQQAGFRSAVVGGYALGAHTCIPEPVGDLTQLVQEAGEIQRAVTIPITIDAGAGFGEAIQVWQTVQRAESAQLGGIQIEDQVYPKRAHYHRDYREHTIDQSHMIEKITAAVEARKNPDFIIGARTDTMRTVGYDEGVKRANAYAKAGADTVVIWPNTIEEARRAPKDINCPVVYVVSHGNRVGRPVPRADELADMGYKIISYSSLAILTVYRAVSATFKSLSETGEAGQAPEDMIVARKAVEDLLGLEAMYAIEERTTESADRKANQH